MGIRLKLSLLTLAVIVLCSGAIGIIAVRNEESFLRQDVELKGLQMLRALAIPCAAPLANNDYNQLDNYLASFDEGEGRDLDLLWVSLLDTEGRIVAHSRPKQFRKQPGDPFTLRALASKGPLSEWDEVERHLHLAVPVSIRELRFGTLTANMSIARLDDRLRLLHIQGAALVGAGGLLALVIMLWALSRLIINPVRALSEAATKLRDGDLAARAPVLRAHDELGVLGEVFNGMAGALQEHTQHLERLVEERTRALTEANERLEHLATTDELTGVKNHRAFQESLRFEILRSQRSKAPVSLIMLDVDHFKRFNDTHGHPAGDVILRTVAQTLRERLRGTDLVARYGGEEFAVLLLDTDKEAAAQVAEALRAAVAERPFPGAETQPEGRVTVSVGLASYPSDAEEAPALVVAADQALYQAKRGGRNRVCHAISPKERSDG